jgi:hypothetical protein
MCDRSVSIISLCMDVCWKEIQVGIIIRDDGVVWLETYIFLSGRKHDIAWHVNNFWHVGSFEGGVISYDIVRE